MTSLLIWGRDPQVGWSAAPLTFSPSSCPCSIIYWTLHLAQRATVHCSILLSWNNLIVQGSFPFYGKRDLRKIVNKSRNCFFLSLRLSSSVKTKLYKTQFNTNLLQKKHKSRMEPLISSSVHMVTQSVLSFKTKASPPHRSQQDEYFNNIVLWRIKASLTRALRERQPPPRNTTVVHDTSGTRSIENRAVSHSKMKNPLHLF